VVKSDRLASHTQDDGFHEIQLNGKQLVFLFMAATVVSVVIFLCGVLVGRGVRAERGTAVETAALADPAATELSLAASPRVSALPGEPPADAPRPAVDDLSYFNRLDQPNPPVEELKATPAPAPAAKPERPAPALSPPVRVPAAPAAAATASGTAAPQAAATQPFAVQIAALNVRSEADAMAKRLSSKGYAAFVLPPANGTPAVYRVRIGPFNTRREADSVAARLQKEEQFKPWVTR
jgi:cell division septation protein DedD